MPKADFVSRRIVKRLLKAVKPEDLNRLERGLPPRAKTPSPVRRPAQGYALVKESRSRRYRKKTSRP